jgi:2,5-diamino-6-(ribosylamino)-4(3H)-pyrimidinone 5'-phosphate reductase
MDRPFVYVNMAATADGKITSAAREYPRFASAADRARMDRLRAEADAIAVGAGTLRADDPLLHVRDPASRRYRRDVLGKPAGLLRVLVTASVRIPPGSRFFDDPDGGPCIVATVEDAPQAALEPLTGRAEVWRLGRGAVDLPALLVRLRDRGVERLLVEGGGELNWVFVQAGLVDELYLTIAPALLGGRDAPTLLEGDGLRMEARVRLRLLALEREGDELFCRYAVDR